VVVALTAGCSGGGSQQSAMPSSGSARNTASNMNGRSGSMPAFYDGQLFTINFAELPPGGESSVLANNKSHNIIYCVSDCSNPNFTPVLNAIQGEGPGFNPLWNEMDITFLTIAPTQFHSDDEVNNALAAHEISLVQSGEVYRCSVIGPGKP
jgi:hypothetical protein